MTVKDQMAKFQNIIQLHIEFLWYTAMQKSL